MVLLVLICEGSDCTLVCLGLSFHFRISTSECELKSADSSAEQRLPYTIDSQKAERDCSKCCDVEVASLLSLTDEH